MELIKRFTTSSQVKEIAYNEAKKEMEVLFMNNKRYVYFEVSIDVWQKALVAESIGKFLNSEIKPTYKYGYL